MAAGAHRLVRSQHDDRWGVVYAATVNMDCLGCLTNESNQACHVGGCIQLDSEGHIQPMAAGDMKGVITSTDPATFVHSLNLEPDQADMIYVDLWSHPEDLTLPTTQTENL